MSKEMWKITVNDYRFKYVGGSNYKNYWVIQKRFLWLFWRNYKKMSYQILDDGYPNINEVMDYIEQLNKKIKNNDIKNLSKIKK